ncbi:MAG: SIMPL domain-containing protein, partial [Holosporales bacterium]|nr:SIMPL domain-containing protein [Holosporales bacterium]
MDYLKFGSSILAVLAFSVIGFQAVSVVKNMGSYISTNGLSDKVVDSDEVVLTISVRNDADVLKEISEKRKKEKDILIDFLTKNGIQNSEIDRIYCDIEENYDYSAASKSDKKKYKTLDKISIKSSRVEDIKKLSGDLSKLVDEGLCVCFEIEYYYKDMDKLRIEMLEEATKDSMNRAERIAE